MKTTIGRIVIYKTTEEDKAQQRIAQAELGCNIQKELPAIIVAVWSDDCVNLKVVCDGHLNIWATSSIKGDAEGEWNWPVIEK